MQIFTLIIIAIVSYLIGSVNFSIMLSKAISGKDIRESGSGNAGATNMLRTHGKKMAVITLLLDVLKGICAVLLATLFAWLASNLIQMWLSTDIMLDFWDQVDGQTFVRSVYINNARYIAAVFVVLGHNFPVYFGFRGGKGVATSLGVVLLLDWQIGLGVTALAILIMAVTRYVSLGSIVGGGAFIIAEIVKMIITRDFHFIRLLCVIMLGGILIARHHANIARLRAGTENKLSFKKKEGEKK